MVKNIYVKLKVTTPASSKNNNRKGYNSNPYLFSFFIPEWGSGLSMLHLKPLKIKRTLPKTPLRVAIMDQRGVRGFGAEEGAPGETMAQNDLKIQVGVGKVRGQCSHKTS